MSLYGKGNWTRLAIDPEDFTKWQGFVDDERPQFLASAFAARTALITNRELDSTVGINPPSWPCGDAPHPMEQQILDRQVHPFIARNIADKDNQQPWVLLEGTPVPDEYDFNDQVFGRGDDFHLFRIDRHIIGFWLVLQTRQNLDDINALKEHAAAVSYGAPFKSLSTSLKKEITASINSDGLVDYIARAQCPVILDYETGAVWIGSTVKKLVDAFKFWMLSHLQTPVNPTRLSLGNNALWPKLALGEFLDKDLYKLDRAEAFTRLLAEAEEGITDADKDMDAMDSDPGDSAAGKSDEDAFVINNIAVYAGLEGSMATVYTDTVIELGAGLTTITAKKPVDAIAILQDVATATIGSSRVKLSTVIGKGMAEGLVDFNLNLVAGAFKGLELDFNTEAKAEIEKAAGAGKLMEETSEVFAEKVCRHWFLYYLRLRQFEQMLINIACSALTLDAENAEFTAVVSRIRDIAPKEEGAAKPEKVAKPKKEKAAKTAEDKAMSDPKVKKALKGFQDGLVKNLLPGESMSISSQGKTVTLHVDHGKLKPGLPPPSAPKGPRERDIEL